MDAKIKKRIQALQAMANDASSEHEAMIAARRLQVLLAKHNISEDEIEVGDVSSDYGEAPKGQWVRTIGKSVAKLYFCKFFFTSLKHNGKAQGINVIGSETHRPIAMNMVKSVIATVDREARLQSKAHRPHGEDPWAFICSFRIAAALRIAERCEELIAMACRGELVDEDTGSTLPALVSSYEGHWSVCDQYGRDKCGLRIVKHRYRNSSKRGMETGKALGDSIPLAQQVGKSAPKMIAQ